MMTWNPQANELFLRANELASPDDRRRFLDGACDGDDALRVEVEGLLAAGDQAGSFLEVPANAAYLAATLQRPVAEQPGTVIGHYKLLEQIGEGGFGVVFMAEQQQPLRRKVALKVLKPGMDTRQVIARFEAERQALALMDHPNIAHVFDGGATDTGRPYFVMELVRGVPITAFCDQSCLDIRQRLKLFVDVCQAMQHAHQKGLIHRDIKPTNVLVTLHDGTPVVKVIDFGVAKAMGQQLTEKTLFTNFAQMVGTPLYMSPEQAEMSGLDVDTRSDIYSLGVLLYELLTGTTPLENDRLSKVGYDEMRRIICEEEPPRPSTRMSTTSKAAATACEKRQGDPRKLSRLFRGELDWIVMKALEKDRNRRYETASGLAADVRHYLDDEPVLACPPSTSYRLRKFARRNRAAIMVGVALLSLLLAAVLTLTVSNGRIRRESDAKAAALKERNAALLTARRAVDQMLVRIADEKLNDVPFANPLRRALLEDAIRFYEELQERSATDAAVRDDILRALKAICTVDRESGRYSDAQQSFEQYIKLLDQCVAENPSDLKYRFDRAYAEESLAYLLEILPSPPDEQVIEDHYRKAIELFTAIERIWPDQAQPMIVPLRHLAERANKRGDTSSAEQLWREAIARGERFLSKSAEHGTDASDSPVEEDIEMSGRLMVAEPQVRSQLCWAIVSLGDLLTAMNRLSEAQSVLQNGLRHADILLKRDPRRTQARDVAASLNQRLGSVYVRMGRIDEGIELLQRAVSEIESLCMGFPRTRGYWQGARYFQEQLVSTLQRADRDDEARASVRNMYKWIEQTALRVPGDTEPLNELRLSQKQIADLLRLTGQEREADQLMKVSEGTDM